MRLTRKHIHEQIYFYWLILIAISLPFSVYATSMFICQLATNWVQGEMEAGPDKSCSAGIFASLPDAPGGIDMVVRSGIWILGFEDQASANGNAHPGGHLYPPDQKAGSLDFAVFFTEYICGKHGFSL